MNPVAVLLPLSVLVLVGATVSTAAERVEPTVRTPSSAQAPSAPAPRSSSRAVDRAAWSVVPPLASAGTSGPPALRGRWAWPVRPQPAVVRPFLRPATKYGAGHRGVDLAGASGQDVLAVEAGTVTHVGSIAGRGTVTVLHASGIRSTYEPVDPTVTQGSAVARGEPLGLLEEGGSHCAPAACLHLGALRGEVYLDPVALLMGGQRVRLLPLGQAPDG